MRQLSSRTWRIIQSLELEVPILIPFILISNQLSIKWYHNRDDLSRARIQYTILKFHLVMIRVFGGCLSRLFLSHQ
ncbi:hypothetical protein AtEden1_Chr2g0224921 [Arabidopsis thaliana]